MVFARKAEEGVARRRAEIRAGSKRVASGQTGRGASGVIGFKGWRATSAIGSERRSRYRMKRERQEPVKFRGELQPAEEHSRQGNVKAAKISTLVSPDWVPPSVALSPRDMAQHLTLLEGQMTVIGDEVRVCCANVFSNLLLVSLLHKLIAPRRC